MEITREFIESEVAQVESEMKRAQEAALRLEGALITHKMLLKKLDENPPNASGVTLQFDSEPIPLNPAVS